MRKLILNSFALLFTSLTLLSQTKTSDELLLKAMKDESARSIKSLKLENLDAPYFIEYGLTFIDSYQVTASLGSLLDIEDNKVANLTANVRVGDYNFDNTNFFDFGLSFFGSGDDEERFKRRNIPYYIDYSGLRRELWLATDAAYKQSAEIYSKKIATKKNRLNLDTTPDFSKITNPYKGIVASNKMTYDRSKCEDLVRKISAIFKDYPEITNSKVIVEVIPKKYLYISTEGTEYVKSENYIGLEVYAFTQASDGSPVADFISFYQENYSDLPSLDSLTKATKEICENINRQTITKKLEESYSGPILFEKQAAAQLFAQMFANNLAAQRAIMTESGVQENERGSAFQNKIGARVLPEFISLEDKPSLVNWGKTKLFGISQIDDDGIASQDLTLVKDGYLKTLLSSRIPTKKIKTSNGRNRRGGTMYTNLLITSKPEKELNDYELKSKLIELIKNRDLPYGIIVKKILDQNILATGILNLAAGNMQFPRAVGAFIPSLVYKVYQDGREELVRGVTGAGFTPQTFKDIINVSKSKYALNFLAPAIISSFISGGDSYVNSSVVCPSFLIEDGEIKTLDTDFKKPPFMANPIK